MVNANELAKQIDRCYEKWGAWEIVYPTNDTVLTKEICELLKLSMRRNLAGKDIGWAYPKNKVLHEEVYTEVIW